jgi:hypothetical protein
MVGQILVMNSIAINYMVRFKLTNIFDFYDIYYNSNRINFIRANIYIIDLHSETMSQLSYFIRRNDGLIKSELEYFFKKHYYFVN